MTFASLEDGARLGLVAEDPRAAVPIRLVKPGGALEARPAAFGGEEGDLALIPDGSGGIAEVLFATSLAAGASAIRALPARLPAGAYRLVASPADGFDAKAAALAWAMGAYRFDRYRTEGGAIARPVLVAPLGGDLAEVSAIASACALARDMVNTPANDMGPAEIETAARDRRAVGAARSRSVTGEGCWRPNIRPCTRSAGPRPRRARPA